MKYNIDHCDKGKEASLENINCEECLEILHERAVQKVDSAYKHLLEVKWRRYEIAYKSCI